MLEKVFRARGQGVLRAYAAMSEADDAQVRHQRHRWVQQLIWNVGRAEDARVIQEPTGVSGWVGRGSHPG